MLNYKLENQLKIITNYTIMEQINFTTEIISCDFDEHIISFELPEWQKIQWWKYQIVKL